MFLSYILDNLLIKLYADNQNMECAKKHKKRTQVSPKHSFIISFEQLYIII